MLLVPTRANARANAVAGAMAVALCGAFSVGASGCGRPGRPANPPALGVAAADVLADVDDAVSRATHGDVPGAAAAATAAADRFDGAVEPTLRATLPPRDVLALEYGFARIRGAIDRGADPSPAAAELGDLLRDAVARASIRRE